MLMAREFKGFGGKNYYESANLFMRFFPVMGADGKPYWKEERSGRIVSVWVDDNNNDSIVFESIELDHSLIYDHKYGIWIRAVDLSQFGQKAA